jgi:hypothetical protein
MSAQAYRRHAAECREMSLAVADPEACAFLKRIAIAWTNLADQAENGSQQQHLPYSGHRNEAWNIMVCQR